MNSIGRSYAALVLAAMLLTGCGGGDGSSVPPTGGLPRGVAAVAQSLSPVSATYAYSVSGYTGTWTITNTSGANVNIADMQFQMTYGAAVSSFWGSPYMKWATPTSSGGVITTTGGSTKGWAAGTTLTVQFTITSGVAAPANAQLSSIGTGTASPTPAPTASPTATPTASVTPTASPSSTASPSASPTPTSTATATASPTVTPSASPSATPTPTPTPTPTASPTPSASPTPKLSGSPVAVAVSGGSNGNVGTGFAGFSYEKEQIGAGMFSTGNSNLVNLFRLLGPSVLRIGGNTVDTGTWNAAGSGGVSGTTSPPDVNMLAAFLQATGWRVLYGINLKTNTPSNAASEAQYVANELGSSLEAFEIGNEPDVYDSESAYQAAFDSYRTAIVAAVPGAQFDGPGASDHNPGWATTFAPAEKSSVSVLATHMYIGTNTKATISGMLASNASGKLPDGEATLGAAKAASGIPLWRMTEANSYFHGGAAGVSNAQAAALWSLDFMYGVASHDGDGVNFHGGVSSQFTLYYSPIQFSGITATGTQSLYYGELLWELAGSGPLHSASVSGNSSVSAFGIGNNVIVNNKSSSTIKVTITLASAAAGGSEYIETASSLSATSGFTIAGSGVSANGAFTPSPVGVSISGNTAIMSVPAGSAALLIVH